MSRYDTVELKVFIHHETDAAYLVSETGDKDDAVWLPKSQLQGEPVCVEKGSIADLEIPEWLAIEKGFV